MSNATKGTDHGWDLSGDPALREALINALADALVAEVERQDACDASDGGEPDG